VDEISEKQNKCKNSTTSPRYVWIAAKHFGKEVEFISDKEAQNNPPSGHDYVLTIKIK
jgi:hypothetical protein